MKRNSGIPLVAFMILIVAALACGQPAEEWQLRGWTVTPSATIVVASATQPTQTPYIVEITNTPEPTKPATILCVVAQEAVHLRPSPNDQNYPIVPLPNGTIVADLGGRSGKWMFVRVGDKQGWVHSDYVGAC